MAKTSLGMDENLEAALTYVLGFISGIIFFLIEKDNKTVKFHAVQSVITFGAIFIISYLLNYIPILGGLLNFLLRPISILLGLFLMYKAYKGGVYKLPIMGKYAEKYAKEIKV